MPSSTTSSILIHNSTHPVPHSLPPPLQVFREQGLIYMVLECGEVDLARLLYNHEEAKRRDRTAAEVEAAAGGQIDENFVRLYWQQMLQVWMD